MCQIRDAIYFHPTPPTSIHIFPCKKKKKKDCVECSSMSHWRELRLDLPGAQRVLIRDRSVAWMNMSVNRAKASIKKKVAVIYKSPLNKGCWGGKYVVFIASFPQGSICSAASHLDPPGYFKPSLTFPSLLKQTQDSRRPLLTPLFIAGGVGHAGLVSVNSR